MALKGVAGWNESEEVWINLDFFFLKIDKLSIGSRFKPEANILYKIPREKPKQEIQPSGTKLYMLYNFYIISIIISII